MGFRLKSLIILVILFNLSYFVKAQPYEPDPYTVALWRFDEGSGNIIHDETGINNGTLIGPTWTVDNAPIYNNQYSLNLDGINDYIEVQNNPTLNPKSITISAWIKAKSIDANHDMILSKWRKTDNAGYYLSINQGRLTFTYISPPSISFILIRGVSTLNIDKWYHVAATFDHTTGTTRLYLNGVLDQVGVVPNSSIIHSTDNLEIGKFSLDNSPPFYFDGVIDEVIIRNISFKDGVNLESPLNNEILQSRDINFNCAALSFSPISNITLYGNWTGNFEPIETQQIVNSSYGPSYHLLHFEKKILPGSYTWNCLACDVNNNCIFADSDYTFTVKNQLSVIEPINNINATVYDTIKIIVNANDLDNDNLTYEINDSRFTQNNNEFTWKTNNYLDVGQYSFLVTVNDGYDTVSIPINVKIDYLCGDINGYNKINLEDIIHLVNFIFKDSTRPVSLWAADANGDGYVSLGDIIYLVNYVFKGGLKPKCTPI